MMPTPRAPAERTGAPGIGADRSRSCGKRSLRSSDVDSVLDADRIGRFLSPAHAEAGIEK